MRQIDDEAFSTISNQSWNENIGLRNVISHGYVTIRIERIWDFLIEDLPEFTASIESAATHLD